IEFWVAERLRTRCPVTGDSPGFIELAKFDTMSGKLIMFDLHRLDNSRPLVRARGRVRFALFHLFDHLCGRLSIADTESVEYLTEFAAGLVRTQNNLLSHGRTFSGISIQQRFVRLLP